LEGLHLLHLEEIGFPARQTTPTSVCQLLFEDVDVVVVVVCVVCWKGFIMPMGWGAAAAPVWPRPAAG